MVKSKKPEPIIPYLLMRPRLLTQNPCRGRRRASPPGAEEAEDPTGGPRSGMGGQHGKWEKERGEQEPQLFPNVLQGNSLYKNINIE